MDQVGCITHICSNHALSCLFHCLALMLALNVNQETWYALYYLKFVALKVKWLQNYNHCLRSSEHTQSYVCYKWVVSTNPTDWIVSFAAPGCVSKQDASQVLVNQSLFSCSVSCSIHYNSDYVLFTHLYTFLWLGRYDTVFLVSLKLKCC